MKQYSVRVRDDFPFDAARVGNRPYTKSTPVLIAEADMTDEIKNSSALRVEEIESMESSEAAVVVPTETPTPVFDNAVNNTSAGDSLDETPTQKKKKG